MQSEKAIGNGYHLQLMNGVLFVILFASAAYQLSQWHYISLLGISPLIVGIVLGMIYGNTLRLQAFLRLPHHPSDRAFRIYGKEYAQARRPFASG